jgi:hypothetical protein
MAVLPVVIIVNQIKEAWKDGTCRMHGIDAENLEKTYHLEDLGANGRIILRLA